MLKQIGLTTLLLTALALPASADPTKCGNCEGNNGNGKGNGGSKGAPGPIAGASLPILLLAGGYVLVRRARRRNAERAAVHVSLTHA